MILMIDNYDSFTYNLVQGFKMFGVRVKVVRNDEITLNQIEQSGASRLVISPGPGRPRDAGISMDVIRHFQGKKDILGICLGHQCIGEVYGGKIIHAKKILHGKTSRIFHSDTSVFAGQPNPFRAARYHSLVISTAQIPACLKVTATTEDGMIMGIRHRDYRIAGVQIHPESFMTHQGQRILANFLEGAI